MLNIRNTLKKIVRKLIHDGVDKEKFIYHVSNIWDEVEEDYLVGDL